MFKGKNVLCAGHSNGSVALWRRGRLSAATPDAQREPVRPFIEIQEHKGPVLCMKVHAEKELLFTGSADRLIKVLDPFGDSKMTVVQTLTGHGGSVTSLVVHDKMLISGGTDRTIIIWQTSGTREMFKYPWFTLQQKIQSFPAWINSMSFSLALHLGGGQLFVGDGDGVIWTTLGKWNGSQMKFQQPKPWPKVHTFGVKQIVAIMQDYLIISVGSDNTLRLFDMQSGSCLRTVTNANRARFSGVAWDSANQEFVAVDETGELIAYRTIAEKTVLEERITKTDADGQAIPLLDVVLTGGGLTPGGTTEIMALHPHGLDVYTIMRGIEQRELSGHEGPVFKITCVDDDVPWVWTGSVDSTVRMWDPGEMTCKMVFKEEEAAELFDAITWASLDEPLSRGDFTKFVKALSL